MPIKVSCSCGQSFNAKDELAGKRVRCPKCKNPLQIPAPQIEDELTLEAPTEVPKYNPLEDILDQEGVKSVTSGPTCPNCSESITPNAVICIHCGVNFTTGEKVTAGGGDDDDYYDDGEDDDEYAMAGMTETEKMLYKAEKELDDAPISADGERFGDEPDSFFVALGALILVGLAVGLTVWAVISLDSIEDFDTVTVSFWMSVLFVFGTQVVACITAFKENQTEGFLCFIPAYCEFYMITRGLYLAFGLRILFSAIAGGCWSAMGGEE